MSALIELIGLGVELDGLPEPASGGALEWEWFINDWSESLSPRMMPKAGRELVRERRAEASRPLLRSKSDE